MEIIKTKSGRYGVVVTHVNEKGIRERTVLSLKKLIIAGVGVIGLTGALASLVPAGIKSVKFLIDENKIKVLREDADKIAELENNTVEIDGKVVSVADEINTLADKKEDLLNTKKSGEGDVDQARQEALEQEEAVIEAAKALIVEKAAPAFDEGEHDSLTYDEAGGNSVVIQWEDQPGPSDKLKDEFIVNTPLSNSIADEESIEKIVGHIPEFMDGTLEETSHKTLEQVDQAEQHITR